MSGEQIATAQASHPSIKGGAHHRLSVSDLRAWIAGAQPHAVVSYAVGYNAELFAGPGVAQAMRDYEALGFVYLKQQRLEPHKFLYLAERSSRPLSNPRKDTPEQLRRSLANGVL